MGAKVPKGHDEIEAIARQLVTDHGSRAPIVASEQLNECIDRGDQCGRDDWVQVVYVIHRLQQGMRPDESW
jgi:hypothetical protein